MTDQKTASEEAPPSVFIRNMEIGAAVFFTALGAFVTIYSALTLQIFASYGPGPAFAPVITGAALTFTAGWKLIKVLMSNRSKFVGGDFDPAALKSAGFVVLLSAAVIPLMDLIGSAVTLAIYVFIIMRYAQKEGYLISLAVALVLPVSLVWLFRSLLSIPLPSGYLF